MIIFPIKEGQRYYDIHYKYILEIFRNQGLDIRFERFDNIHNTKFLCSFFGKKIIFDFSDGADIIQSDIPIFKFHYTMDHKTINNTFPFAPISFYDWKNEYYDLKEKITYKAQGKILNNQKAYGGAKERRTYVKELLSKLNNVDFEITDKLTYFKKINDCLVSVHVPGFCNNMLDRSTLQFMALGCCIISPYLPEILPYDKSLIPDIHYIKCENDYSNLIQIINSIDREKCLSIGRCAKELFEQYFTPKELIQWIHQKL